MALDYALTYGKAEAGPALVAAQPLKHSEDTCLMLGGNADAVVAQRDRYYTIVLAR